MAVWSEVKNESFEKYDRLDAEFYQPIYLEVEERLNTVNAVRLESLLVDIRYGLNVEPDYVEEGLPFIRAMNLKEYGIEGEVLKIPFIAEDIGELNVLENGDLLIVRSGANVGDIGIVTDDLAGSTFGSYVIRLKLNKEIVNPAFLYVFLKSKFGREQTVRFRSGTAQPNISIPNLKEVLIYLPPLEKQAEAEKYLTQSYRTKENSKTLYQEAEAMLLHELGLDALVMADEITYERNFDEVIKSGRIDAEYFHPEKKEVQDALAKMTGLTVGEHFSVVNDLINPQSKENQKKKDVKVQNYDLDESLQFFLDDIEQMNLVDLGSAKKAFQKGDVVVSRLRSYLKEIAIVKSSNYCVGSSEYIVLRNNDSLVSPELLTVYLRSSAVQKILKWSQDGSNHPRFKETELLAIKIPDKLILIQDKIIELLKNSIDSITQAKQLLEDAKQRVEDMILGA